MTLELYFTPQSCALVPLIALHEADARFTAKTLNFRRGEHMAPDYLRLNPKHKVPVLVIDGEILTENVAILQWIAREFPAAQLLPETGLDAFRAVALMAWCASGIHPALTPNVRPERYCDLPESAESVRRCAQKLLLENYQIAEDLLRGKAWFFERFTLPDAYFFWAFRRGMQFGMDLTGFPACLAHLERVAARPKVQTALAFEAEALTQLTRDA